MKTVLLVDYDPRRIDKIRRCLRALGAQTVLATDGESGEREFHRLLPDLTIIEDILPKKRGFQLCSDLKSTVEGEARAVFLMAHPRRGSRQNVRMSRCDAFIEEPVDEARLLSKVGRFLLNTEAPISDA